MLTRSNLGPQFPSPSYRPFLRYFDGEQGGGAGGSDDPGFPKDTPVKDMTVEQQAAYWKHQSRRHEGRVNAYGNLTPEQVQALQQENQNLKQQSQSEADKAIEAAREEGRNEVRPLLNRTLGSTALEKALQNRVPDAGALIGLDPTQFVKDGKVDADAIKTWVEDNSEPTQAKQEKRKPIDMGQGPRDEVTPSAGDRGRGEAARRFPKKNTDS
jgi:hypothetical protein